MTTMMDHVDYLSKDIGARPAGTEEEQQAALYIAEQFQKESSFPATIEEFTSSSNLEGANAILAVVTFVVTVLAMLFNVLVIPAFVLALIAAVVYALEAFDKPILSKILARGASQNVVAKYQPFQKEESRSKRGRSRKIVLVAHYDSGKVKPALVERVESFGLPLGLICIGGMAATVLLLLIRVFVGSPVGIGGIILNVLTILALIIVLLPIVKAVLVRIAPYNEGANNNAAGVAALIEVARRIGRGTVSEADLAAEARDVVIHGEQAAEESGYIPEGARIRYEAEQLVPSDELGAHSEEERLLSAKAAIAALTGKPVERKVYGSVADRLVNSRASAVEEQPGVPEDQGETEQADQAVQETVSESADVPAPVSAVEPVVPAEPTKPVVAAASSTVSGFENAPSWFIAAQQNAKRSPNEGQQIQRSRYTEAIETAEREMAERENAKAEEERRLAAERLRVRESEARAAIASTVAAASAEAEQEEAEQSEPLAVEPNVVDKAPLPQDEVIEVAADESPEISQVEQAPLDPSSTVAHAPISMDELQGEIEEAKESSFIAPPEEFTMPSRRFELPKIDSSQPSVAENTNPSRSGLFRMLRSDVPSMSGVIRMQEAGEDVSQKPEDFVMPEISVPQVEPLTLPGEDSFGVDYDMEIPASDGQFAPIENMQSGDVFDEGYDDVDYDAYDGTQEIREVGQRPSVRRSRNQEPAGADYEPNDMSMPSSRAGGFFSRFRKKKNEELEETPQQWLDIDEDFDARSVGRKRGGWESFRDDQFDDFEDEHGWNGGAFSRVRLGHVDLASGEGSEADEQDPLIEQVEDHALVEDMEQIYHFRNPLFNTEVWFVAIGSDTSLHDGARAFIEEHGDELRGSMIIEVESLGLGALSVASEEGRYRKLKASSRVKRYMKHAIAATGISPSMVALSGSDSISTTLQKAGFQTMHLFGEENGVPALKGSADDVLENVDELTLDENTNFLFELVKRG